MTQNKTGRAAREERERQLLLKHKFNNRITTVKFGKESLDVNDYAGSIRKFSDYLAIQAEVKGCKDIYSLRTNNFDPKKDVTEMLMISHLYFEMARLYDASPKFHDESKRCLDQFVHFSANQPYQVVNSELIRKHLKKSVFKNTEAFRIAYTQIYVQSKKCYVVTFCYGDTHPVTQEYRALKEVLLNYPMGMWLIQTYYRHSSVLVEKWQDSSIAMFVGQWLIRPALMLFSKTILPLILNK